jgi:hypothetical protein
VGVAEGESGEISDRLEDARVVNSRLMERTTGLLLLLPLLLLVESSCSGSPSQRIPVEYTLKDGTKVTCLGPPPDVIAKDVKVDAVIQAAKIGTLLKGTGGVSLDIERIRQEVPPDVSSFEIIDDRLCLQYVNGVLSKEEYHSFTEQILPAYKKSIPDKPFSDVGAVAPTSLAETCEQSTVGLKKRPKEFLPEWRSVLDHLHKERFTYDLRNLFEVRGRLPADGRTGKDLIHEATFTLNCLQENGELRMEMLGTTSRYWGEDFENQKIIFRNP